MSAFEKLCMQRHGAYVRYLNNSARDSLVRAYIASRRITLHSTQEETVASTAEATEQLVQQRTGQPHNTKRAQERPPIMLLDKDVLCQILRMSLRPSPFIVYYQKRSLTVNAIVKMPSTLLVNFAERGRSSLQFVRWVCRATRAQDMPRAYWKTHEQWTSKFDKNFPRHKIQRLWKQHCELVQLLSTNTQGAQWLVLDKQHIARNIDGMPYTEELFENGSEWFVDGIGVTQAVVPHKIRNRLLLFEPASLRQQQVTQMLTRLLGRAIVDRFVIVREMKHGCQVFFLGGGVLKERILQNCTFDGFSMSAAADGRIVAVNGMPKGFRIQY